MDKKKYTKKQIKKLSDGMCFFCGEDNYLLLDTHRLIPGSEGGQYNNWNMSTLCCMCHRKVHSGLIKILGKHHSTGSSLYVIHYIDENGKEIWGRPPKK